MNTFLCEEKIVNVITPHDFTESLGDGHLGFRRFLGGRQMIIQYPHCVLQYAFCDWNIDFPSLVDKFSGE